MFGDQEYRSFLTHLRHEHAALRSRVSKLLDALPEGDEGMSQEVVQTLLSQALQLQDCLQKHFAEESSGGCIDEAVCRRPILTNKAADLEHEHPALLEQLEEIVQMLLPGESAPTACELRAQSAEFAANLLLHEGKEDRLLLEGFDVVKDDERFV